MRNSLEIKEQGIQSVEQGENLLFGKETGGGPNASRRMIAEGRNIGQPLEYAYDALISGNLVVGELVSSISERIGSAGKPSDARGPYALVRR